MLCHQSHRSSDSSDLRSPRAPPPAGPCAPSPRRLFRPGLTPLSGQALGQRWLILPLASLGVGGSLPVTIGLSGAFVAYALVVLVADAAAALSLRGAPRAPLLAAGSAVPLTAALVLSRSPMFGSQLGLFTLGYCALGAGGALALTRDDRTRTAAALYCVWATTESLFGMLVGFGLNMAAGSLVSDEMDVTEAEWGWLAGLVYLNYMLGFVSALLSALTARDLLRPRSSFRSFGVSESPESSLGLELLSAGGGDLSTQLFGDRGGVYV